MTGWTSPSLTLDKERARSFWANASWSKLLPKRDKDERRRDSKSEVRESTMPAWIRGEARMLSAAYRCERQGSMPNR
jgi:hypothetical protein